MVMAIQIARHVGTRKVAGSSCRTRPGLHKPKLQSTPQHSLLALRTSHFLDEPHQYLLITWIK